MGTAAVLFVYPTNNVPYKARILAQSFGSRRAPSNWGRVATFIQFLSRGLLTLTVGAFVGDVYCAEPSTHAPSGFWASKQHDGSIGFPTADKRGELPSKNIALLGALISIRDDSFCAAARPDRVNKICGHIAHALRTTCLSPAAESMLRGRLGFYSSLLSGKLGRGTMGPLIARQYRQRAHTLTPELTRNLVWRYSAIGRRPPRVTPFVFREPVGAHRRTGPRTHCGGV